MNFFKRVFLFIAVNALVITSISIILRLLGVQPYLTSRGIDYQTLLVFCLVWGMGGAFISLALSRVMAKMLMGVKVIDPQTSAPDLRRLLQTVHELSRRAGLETMPEVGIYRSPEVNAFATGPTRSRALVAVSEGLLQRMDDHEIHGVLAHEVSHIANGDMVTMTLLQGVVNAFAMFLARVIAFAISSAGRSERDRGFGMSTYLIQMLLEMVFLFFGSMVIAAFSRYREFRADAGGAKIGTRENMIAALEKLQQTYEPRLTTGNAAFQNLKISSRTSGWMRLFATHPPLEERIQKLQRGLA